MPLRVRRVSWPIFARHSLDLLTVHGRTVAEMYRTRGPLRFHRPRRRRAALPGAGERQRAFRPQGRGGAAIDRGARVDDRPGAIRNPWVFEQIRQNRRGEPLVAPTGRDVLGYIHSLYEAVCLPDFPENAQVQKMKRYVNFIGLGVDADGGFLHAIRRAETREEFFAICAEYLDHAEAMSLEPLPIALKETDVLAGAHG